MHGCAATQQQIVNCKFDYMLQVRERRRGILRAIIMRLLVALYNCSACFLGAETTEALDVQGLPGDVHGELQPSQSKTIQCDFLPLHEGLVRFPLLQLMSSADGRIHDVLAEDAYVTAGGE